MRLRFDFSRTMKEGSDIAHIAALIGDPAGGLLRPRKQGRHKYFALASDDVACVLEGLTGLAAGSGHLRTRTGPKDAELR